MGHQNLKSEDVQLAHDDSDVALPLLKGGWRSQWMQNRSVLLMFVAQFVSSFISTTVKLLQTTGGDNALGASQILFSMMSIQMILSWMYMWLLSVPNAPFGERAVWKLLSARGISGFIGIWGYYYSLRFLPLSEATVINFLAPIAAAFACSILLQAPFTLIQQVAGGLSIVGVVLISKPWHIVFPHVLPCLSDAATKNATASVTDCTLSAAVGSSAYLSPLNHIIAISVAFVGVLGGACSYVSLAWLGSRAHPILSVGYFATFSVIFSALTMPLGLVGTGEGFRWPAGLIEWLLLAFLGVFGFAMQVLVSASLAWDGDKGSSRALNVVYVQVVFALLVDKFVWGLWPDWKSSVGGVLVLGSVIGVALRGEGHKGDTTLWEGAGRDCDNVVDNMRSEWRVRGEEECVEEELGLMERPGDEGEGLDVHESRRKVQEDVLLADK